MSGFVNMSYLIDRNFNDLGPHSSSIAPVGKIEVTILDNLYRISQLLHGRIVSSASIAGGYKIYIGRNQLRDLIYAYQTISTYKLSPDLDPLIQSLRALLTGSSNEVEIGIDSRIILQMITVHNSMSTKLKGIWEGVVALRFMSCSGFNKDITIDGKQQILNSLLSKFSSAEMQVLIPEIERSGQLAGIRGPRQVDTKDMIADLLFSRKDSYVTLHQLFHTMTKQRNVLREFRTDVLFCPVERFKELDSGFMIKTTVTVTEDATTNNTTIGPEDFTRCEFILKNRSVKDIQVNVAGSIGTGVTILYPLQEIRVAGTSITVPSVSVTNLSITLLADVRDLVGTGASIVSLAMQGKLKDNKIMLNLFYQIIQPVMPYFNSLVRRCTEGELLKLVLSKMSDKIKNLIANLKPGNIYTGWLLTDKASNQERLVYIYLLTIMLPECLLDPTFTFSDSVGTPPYIHEYGSFVQSFQTLYQ